MSDRFPSIEEIDSGPSPHPLPQWSTNGADEAAGAAPIAATNGGDDLLDGGGDSTSDFLSRERAALGDDADQFTSANDDTDDLLGGGDGLNGTSQEETQFRQNFPAVDSRNEVSF